MEQEKITINGIAFRQPDEEMPYDFETTYTEDSARVISGPLHDTPLFTVERFTYSVSRISAEEMSKLLQNIVAQHFMLHYFSPYYGTWRDDEFYVGKGSLKIRRVIKDSEHYSGISFNMVGVNPI